MICPEVCWRGKEERHNSTPLRIMGTMIKCLPGTFLLVSGSGGQLDAAVSCHAGIATDSAPCCTGGLFAQALQGGDCWSSGMLQQLVKVKTKSLGPVFVLLVTTWAARAALQHGVLYVTPRAMSWLCMCIAV